MTTTTAKPGYGSSIKVERNGVPGTFDKIPNLSMADMSGIKAKMVEATHLDGGGWEEKIPTTLDAGQITADVHYDETNAIHNQILLDLVARTPRNFQFVSPSGTKYVQVAGFYESFNPSAKPDAPHTRKLVVQLTGPATFV